MKAITQYRAEDGAIFNTPTECENYERLALDANRIMEAWRPLPDNDQCNFANGGGYYQHDPVLVEETKQRLMSLAETAGMSDIPRLRGCHFSHFLRYLDDADRLRPIREAAYRVMCCDERAREWGQPYYANNPDKGKQIQLNA